MTETEAGSPEAACASSPEMTSIPGDGNTVSAPGLMHPARHPREEEREVARQDVMHGDFIVSPALDSLTKLSATICEAPVAYLSILETGEQFSGPQSGVDLPDTCPDDPFSKHIIESDEEAFVVPDMEKDPRFARNPRVTGKTHVRFIAGVPLATQEGLPLGSLYVLDSRPRDLTRIQLQMLTDLSHVAVNLLCLNRKSSKVKGISDLIESLLCKLTIFYKEIVPKSLKERPDPLMDMARHLDPAMAWISARITQFGKDSCHVINNPNTPSTIVIGDLWKKVSEPVICEEMLSVTKKYFTPGIPEPNLALLFIPFNVMGEEAGSLEFIVPNQLELNRCDLEIVALLIGRLTRVIERESMHAELYYRASFDPLTGAANRTLFLNRLAEAIEKAQPKKMNSVLFFIDLDDFKDVNDNFGHHTGDALLVAITKRLVACSRENDTVGRLSGDEFVLLANDIDNEEALGHLLKRLHASFGQPLQINSNQLMVSASIGCVPVSNPHTSVEKLMQQVEGVMYLVKNGHHKGICVADEEILRTIRHQRSMILEVKEALQKNRLLLYAQPIVDLKSGMIAGAEMLLRVTGRKGNILPADEFISMIERSHYLVMLDEWVFTETLRIIGNIRDEFPDFGAFKICINVTPAILNTLGYGNQCISRIKACGIDPANIVMEITENNLVPLVGRVIDNLHLLREGNVRIAVDDFGTGYSNLRNLSTLPLDFLKIDRTLVTASCGISKSEALLGATMAIAENLGLEIIAEGVETSQDEDLVRSLGCRLVQGYLYGKPMPMDDFMNLLRKQFFMSELPGMFSDVEVFPSSDSPALTESSAGAT